MAMMGNQVSPSAFLEFPWKALSKHWEYPTSHFLFGVYSALEENQSYGASVAEERQKREKLSNAWANIHKKGV